MGDEKQAHVRGGERRRVTPKFRCGLL